MVRESARHIYPLARLTKLLVNGIRYTFLIFKRPFLLWPGYLLHLLQESFWVPAMERKENIPGKTLLP